MKAQTPISNYRSSSLSKDFKEVKEDSNWVFDDIILFVDQQLAPDLKLVASKDWATFRALLQSHDPSRISQHVRALCRVNKQGPNQENIDPQSTEQLFQRIEPRIKPEFQRVSSTLIQTMKSNHTHIDILQKMNKQTEQPAVMQRDREEDIRKNKRRNTLLTHC